MTKPYKFGLYSQIIKLKISLFNLLQIHTKTNLQLTYEGPLGPNKIPGKSLSSYILGNIVYGRHYIHLPYLVRV